jgi:hypothetical protein
MTTKENLVKSKQRVFDHGEVFTPAWMVEAMLDLVKDESERIDSRFLEPACGSGNFIGRILQRKLAAVELRYGHLEFERKHFSLLGLMCIYGLELLADNVAECRANALNIFAEYTRVGVDDDFYQAAVHVLTTNIQQGDALTMRMRGGGPIVFAEWGYLGKGRYQRRDLRLDVLTGSSNISTEGTPVGGHPFFKPIKTYPPMNVRNLAAVENDKKITEII